MLDQPRVPDLFLYGQQRVLPDVVEIELRDVAEDVGAEIVIDSGLFDGRAVLDAVFL